MIGVYCQILILFITSLASDPLAAKGDDRYHPLPSGKTRKLGETTSLWSLTVISRIPLASCTEFGK